MSQLTQMNTNAIRECSNNIWRFRRGFAHTVRMPSYGGGGLAKSSYNFYSGWKSLIHISSCSVYSTVYWGLGLSKTSYGERRLAENVRIPS